MYICMDCGDVFEEPRMVKERMPDYWGAPAWEEYGTCPFCGSVEYTEARRCDRCGAYMGEGNAYGFITICDLCLEDLTF